MENPRKYSSLASYVYIKGWVKHRGWTFQCNIITQAFVPSDLFCSPWAVWPFGEFSAPLSCEEHSEEKSIHSKVIIHSLKPVFTELQGCWLKEEVCRLIYVRSTWSVFNSRNKHCTLRTVCVHTSSDFNIENKTYENKDKILTSFDIWKVFISLLTMLYTFTCIVTTPCNCLHSVLSIGSSSMLFIYCFFWGSLLLRMYNVPHLSVSWWKERLLIVAGMFFNGFQLVKRKIQTGFVLCVHSFNWRLVFFSPSPIPLKIGDGHERYCW